MSKKLKTAVAMSTTAMETLKVRQWRADQKQ
jgi:hypothetical protein